MLLRGPLVRRESESRGNPAKPTNDHLRLRRYLCRRQLAEECYYQTVLGNFLGLRIRSDKAFLGLVGERGWARRAEPTLRFSE